MFHRYLLHRIQIPPLLRSPNVLIPIGIFIAIIVWPQPPAVQEAFQRNRQKKQQELAKEYERRAEEYERAVEQRVEKWQREDSTAARLGLEEWDDHKGGGKKNREREEAELSQKRNQQDRKK